MKKTIVALALIPSLALGVSACSEEDQQQAGDAASKAAEEGGELADDAGSAAEDAASDAGEAVGDVDWSKYGENAQDRIDKWAAQDNCKGLNKYVKRLDPNQDGDVISYVKERIEEAGCA